MIDALLHDIRYAVRGLRRSPGFSLVVILTLAFGIGANTALYSVLNALVLRTLPVKEPGRLVMLSINDSRGQPGRFLYYDTYVELASRQHVFEAMSLYVGGGLLKTETRGELSEGGVEAATPGYYDLLGVRPHLGRFIAASDAPAVGDAAPVVVLGYRFWQRQFGADPRAVGETMKVDGVPLSIIGVTPPEYRGLYVDGGADFMVPLSVIRRLAGDPRMPIRSRSAIGRLRPGITLEQARAEISTMFPAIHAATIPPGLAPREQDNMRSERVQVDSIATGFSGLRARYAAPLQVLIALTALLLTIGCANLSGLLLARAVAREQQLAICLALGATRARLVQQLVVESLLLSALGACAAVLLAWWASDAIAVTLWAGAASPRAMSMTPDARVLGLMAAVATAIGLTVGALPGVVATRTRDQIGLQPAHTVAGSTGLWGRSLLVAQVALSLVLVFGAALFAGSLAKLRAIDVGFHAEGIVWGRAFAVPGGYNQFDEASYYPMLVSQLSSLPGVQSVALSKLFPAFFSFPARLDLIARTGDDASTEVPGVMETVSPRFFETVGILHVQGRDFTWHDDLKGTAVAIVNRSLSQKLFAGANPLGQRIRVGNEPARRALDIVGVVDDAVITNLKTSAHQPVVFRPSLQEPRIARASDVSVRTTGDPHAAADAMRHTVMALGHEYLRNVQTLDEELDRSLLQERLLATLSSLCAAMAVLLAFIGLHGLLAYAVARRRREIGVRMALGASRLSVMRLVVGEGLALTLLGVTIGVPFALLVARLVGALLFGLKPSDPATLVGAALFFVVVGATAGFLPGLRASSVDPMTALRDE
jgi:predicted permease